MSVTSISSAPVQGAYTDLSRLIGLRHAARDISLTAQRKALNALSGPNPTRFRGRGVDFEEVRQYQPGDDIRTIDWRVTARSGSPHTKLFREDRERPTLIAIDQRAGMFFGSQHCFKSVLAVHVAALIGWAGLSRGDRVGGLVFADQQHQEIRPARNRKAILRLLNIADEYNHALSVERATANGHSASNGSGSLLTALQELLRTIRPGSALFLISDLAGYNAECEKCLSLLTRHNDVTVLFIHDQLEEQLPPSGYYSFTDGQQRRQIFTGDQQLRDQYQQNFTRLVQGLQQSLSRLGIPMVRIATHDSPLLTLQHYFGLRRGR